MNTNALPRSLPPLVLSAEVRDALAQGRAVVALESTIITHGMPWPQNVETARQVENLVRAEGGVPATIAIIAGKIHVGLDDSTLEWLGTARDVMKVSRADLAYALSAGRHGSTTVAATMICAQLAGIRVFATGGIGGVHRGVEETMDISADLTEFARTPVAVVCAGAKALLDLPRTLEFLETQGVPVVGYETNDFPAFWSRSSGLPVPLRADSAKDIASMIAMRTTLALEGGVVVANPVPQVSEIPRAEMETFITQAVEEARRDGITGKAVTPYLLSRMLELTAGRSLETNIALVLNNARLATHIALALSGKA
ncbi:pseudouridine-5'-phosphate glycosidase [Komagataeibacter medellinensis]|uniref:Pseudouridine-5'-phosphate glycosidase n=1 Tax=Komagataeibacter medellinensis (strain NBRC 3288 / BCRC 11682 / LMG 1693 / Kondo 51) TaxID=634177 RepID=G2I3V1_KOMMN|nr:pseudouridine-5'-phosphate glycosidase [Komagataeibacter medellinensis]BAK82798.1 indigoidine synthase A family protein [Komagataeibacter medellinensis NBRC 3288]